MSKYLNKANRYCIFDTETESLNLAIQNRPWELAYGVVENGELKSSHQRFIWWSDLNIGKRAAQVTRFDYKKYKEKAEDPHIVYEDFRVFLEDEDTYLVSQNGLKFDIYMIKTWLSEAGLWNGYGSWVERMVDINPIFKAFQKNVMFDDDNFMTLQYGWANLHERGLKSNLTFMCKHFNIEIDETRTHEGLYDMVLTSQCLNRLIYHYQQ